MGIPLTPLPMAVSNQWTELEYWINLWTQQKSNFLLKYIPIGHARASACDSFGSKQNRDSEIVRWLPNCTPCTLTISEPYFTTIARLPTQLHIQMWIIGNLKDCVGGFGLCSILGSSFTGFLVWGRDLLLGMRWASLLFYEAANNCGHECVNFNDSFDIFKQKEVLP